MAKFVVKNTAGEVHSRASKTAWPGTSTLSGLYALAAYGLADPVPVVFASFAEARECAKRLNAAISVSLPSWFVARA